MAERSSPQPGPESTESSTPAKIQVRLPGLVTDEQIGLGDVIKRATSTVGFRTSGCGGCNRRAAMLNRWVAFRR